MKKKTTHKSGQFFDSGDLLFGKLRPYLGNILLADFKGIAVGDFWVFKNGLTSTNFLYPFLYSSEFSRVSNISSGSKMPRSDWELVSNWVFHYPLQTQEQSAIGSYFKKLDEQITATEAKIEELRKVKAASLQAMFPQEGETKPRLRFKGFSDDWKMRSIGSMGFFYSGISGKQKGDFGIGNAQYITFLNVLSNAHIDISILENVNINANEGQNQVRKGDLFFNTSSETPEEVGMCSVLMEDVKNVYLNSFCFGFRPTTTELSPQFFAYLMRSFIGRSIMRILAQGATRFNLSKSNLASSKIIMPSTKAEQQKIADYFSNLDRLISLEEQHLEKLRQIKAACLDSMFV